MRSATRFQPLSRHRQFRRSSQVKTLWALPRPEPAKQRLSCSRFWSVLLPGPRGKVRALIIAPTRELAEQIHVFNRRTGTQHGPEELHDLRRREYKPADPETARRCRYCRRLSRPSARSPEPENDRSCEVWRSLSLTRQTACSTWVFCPISGGSSNNCRQSARR